MCAIRGKANYKMNINITKKRIAVVATSAAIGKEKGLNRMFYLAELLARNGFSVDFITSDFQHWTKSHRKINDSKFHEFDCNIIFLHELGYKKNVDPMRVLSHYIFANNLKKYLKNSTYDLVYSDLPDNHVSAVCAKYAKKNGIPYVADVEDLWPKAMKMAFNIPIVSNILFSYFSHDAKITYKYASAIVGSSDTYRDDSLNYGIVKDKKITVYVGNDLKAFDNGVKLNYDKIEKNDNEFWVTYAGTLGTSYDIKTLIASAAELYSLGEKDVRIMILGDGPLRAEFEKYAGSLNGNVIFTGYQAFDYMAAYLAKSDVVVNSVKKNAPQSIVSKIGDYLASGKPMINTCVDIEFWKKVEKDGFGVNVEPENVSALVDTILYLKNNNNMCKDMGMKARAIAEHEFDRSKAFMKIYELVKELTD